ncbi:hypothetical protein C8R46DRAFT_123487 [Mycena filopes]|nr:hypothetical protein C8R46DRAFT_123487 [Mycena filopes]
MLQPSLHPHRVAPGVGVYTTGFVLNTAQLTAISLAVCDDTFRKNPVFALKWHIERFHYELIPLEDGDDTPHLFALSFFPYTKNAKVSDARFNRARSLSEQQKNVWQERFGRHAGLSLDDMELHTIRYPTHGAIANFLEQEIEAAVRSNNEFWEFMVQVPVSSIHPPGRS